ncbi:MAG: universal stress protein [Thiobacillus sp.]|nr:universal stress protein [Thiobacillus sp.]
MIRKLLVAYDGSPASRAAFDFACDLADRYDADMHVLAVARPPEFGEEVETGAVIRNSTRHYQSLLDELRAQAGGRTIHCEVRVGHPAEVIVLYAEDHAIDHIVIGHRGRGVFERWLLGSVARQVVAYATCAVTVVRPPRA